MARRDVQNSRIELETTAKVETFVSSPQNPVAQRTVLYAAVEGDLVDAEAVLFKALTDWAAALGYILLGSPNKP